MNERERFEKNSGSPSLDGVEWCEQKQKYVDAETREALAQHEASTEAEEEE